MTYRTDKFQVGDKVTICPNLVDRTDATKRLNTQGTLTIREVYDRPYYSYKDESRSGCASNWDAMGHTQHVRLEEEPGTNYSGAFFVKA